MSQIHNAVYHRMKNFPGLWTASGGHIYHYNFPQKAVYPGIIYFCASTRHIQDYQGKGGLAASLFQFETLGPDTDQNAEIVTQLRLCFQGWAETVLGIKVSGTIARGEFSGPFDPDAQLYNVTAQHEFWHNEAEPSDG